VCDPQWHACLVPNFASPVVKQCPTKSPPRDTAFGDAALVAMTGERRTGTSAVLTDDGDVVTRTDARLARDRKGTVFSVMRSSRVIELTTSTDRGATWSSPIAVDDGDDCRERGCDRPLITFGKDIVYVIYAAGDNGLRVRASRDRGKTFTTGPIALAGTNASAAATSDGKLHVVAMTGSALGAYGSAQQVVEYAASSDGGATFSAPIVVSGRDELLPYFFATPVLTVDTQRRWLYVAYARGGRNAAWDLVIAASKDNGATWKRTTLAGDGCAMHMVPTLALDAATGTLHVAYYDSEGAPGRFVHATCGPGALKCKVLGAINSVPLPLLSLARGTTKSVGDYESLIVDDKRKMLHAVWAQNVDEAGKSVTRIFHAAAKLKK